MSFTADGRRMRGRARLCVLVLSILWSQTLWADEVEVGLQGVAVGGSVPGTGVSFSGASTTGVWMLGGYGSGFWSPSLSLAGGGALVGIRPLPMLTLLAKAGLGAGFHAGEAGATRQWGLEVAWGGSVLAVAGSWERAWNLAQLPSLPLQGKDIWSLGVRYRFDADER